MAEKPTAKKPAKKKQAPKKKGRKPFEFTPALLKKIKHMASTGLTQEQIAINIGIDPTNLSKKKNTNDQLCQAIKEGKEEGIKQVTNALFNKAMEGDNTAMLFFLCNRDKNNWRHVSNIQHDDTNENLAKVLEKLFDRLPD